MTITFSPTPEYHFAALWLLSRAEDCRLSCDELATTFEVFSTELGRKLPVDWRVILFRVLGSALHPTTIEDDLVQYTIEPDEQNPPPTMFAFYGSKYAGTFPSLEERPDDIDELPDLVVSIARQSKANSRRQVTNDGGRLSAAADRLLQYWIVVHSRRGTDPTQLEIASDISAILPFADAAEWYSYEYRISRKSIASVFHHQDAEPTPEDHRLRAVLEAILDDPSSPLWASGVHVVATGSASLDGNGLDSADIAVPIA